jgi:hypothetical protein
MRGVLTQTHEYTRIANLYVRPLSRIHMFGIRLFWILCVRRRLRRGRITSSCPSGEGTIGAWCYDEEEQHLYGGHE